MWPVTDRFMETLQHDHTRVSRTEILIDNEVVTTIEGEPVDDPITGLQVFSIGGKADVTRTNIRRSGDCTLANVSGIFNRTEIRELLRPLRNEFRLWAGVIYWDALDPVTDREYVPIGTFGIDSVDVTQFPAARVTGYDRMWHVQRSSFTQIRPYIFQRWTTALIDILDDALPSAKAVFNFPDDPEFMGFSTFDEQADRAEACQGIAVSHGQVLYVDPMGVFSLMDSPEPTQDNVVASYIKGVNSTMFRPDRVVSGGQAFNMVIARGDDPGSNDLAARGVWIDDNPDSLTYIYDVGPLPIFYSSPLLLNDGMAASAARTIGLRESGITDSIVQPIVCNPAHDSGDVIYVEDPDQEIAGYMIADEFPVPQTAGDGPQPLQCRTQVFR